MKKNIYAFVAAHVITFLFCLLSLIAYINDPKGVTYIPLTIIAALMVICVDVWGRCIDKETRRKEEGA